jgi:hypothetical protein
MFLGQDRENAFCDLSITDDTSPKSRMDSFDSSHQTIYTYLLNCLLRYNYPPDTSRVTPLLIYL